MSQDMTSERVCYVHCNFCTTILAVSVPCSSMFTMVTVRCGHCANLLSVNMGALIQSSAAHGHLQDFQKQQYGGGGGETSGGAKENNGSSSSSSSSRYCNGRYVPFQAEHEQQPKMPAIRPPEKRQRVPSAYNRFIKEEIQRIKASNPEISHREAFSTAAKNWAHFPHIHFGLSNKQAKLTQEPVAGGEGSVAAHKSLGFY